MKNPVYIYCILDGGRDLPMQGSGFAKRDLYMLSYRDIGAVVSDIPAEYSVDRNEENILLHEEVIEMMMQASALLPMRFGTVTEGKDGVMSILKKYYEDFGQNLDRVAGRVEMGLKIIWPVEKIKAEIAENVLAQENDEILTDQRQGTAYLKAKLKTYCYEKALRERADKAAREISAVFGPCLVEHRTKTLLTEKIAFSGAYLVPKERVEDFRGRYELIKEHYPDYKFLLTGPWPPYNFIKLSRHEEEVKL